MNRSSRTTRTIQDPAPHQISHLGISMFYFGKQSRRPDFQTLQILRAEPDGARQHIMITMVQNLMMKPPWDMMGHDCNTIIRFFQLGDDTPAIEHSRPSI